MNNGMLGPGRNSSRHLRRKVWDLAIVQYRLAAGTNGGNVAAGFNVTPLNAVLLDLAGIVKEVASNRVKLEAGLYRVNGYYPSMYGQRCRPRIRNVTDGITVARGPESYGYNGNAVMSKAYACGEFECFRTILLEMQQYHEIGSANGWNLGYPGFADGSLECYAQLEIERLRA